MQLRWIASPDASALYAADAVRRGRPFTDDSVVESIREPANKIHECFEMVGSSDRLWRNLVALAVDIRSNQALAEMTFRKSFAIEKISPSLLIEVSAWIAEVKTATKEAIARRGDVLANRVGLLKQQWEARGPGLMKRVAWLSHEQVVIAGGIVGIVHPWCGGGGFGYFKGNIAIFEGLLVDAHDGLPEVLRLGWICSQLNLSLPMFCEEIHPDRFLQVAELAMLPVVLEAAEHVELARCDEATLKQAADAWLNHPPTSTDFWDTLFAWWETCRDGSTPWGIALRGLDQMLAAEE